MSRNIPSALLAHLQEPVTTTCRLLRFTLKDGRVFGMTTLDREIEYEDVVYSAIQGFDPSIIATDAGLSVDNGEAKALLATELPGITYEMVYAGEIDDAQWTMMIVNWRDLSMGHAIIDAGDTGEVTVQDDVIWMPELLSYAMRLRQSIGSVYSRRCRAIFGTPANSHTGCGVDADALWVSGTVTGIGDEPRRVFADAVINLPTIPLPGRLRWLTGRNASSRLYQIEAFSEQSGTIGLLEPTPFDIEAGDEFEIRPDCDKSPASCTAYGNWLNYKGENLIPVGDGVESLTPQSQVPGGFVGSEVIE